MTANHPSSAIQDLFAALLRGETVPWSAWGMPAAEFVQACREQALTGLVQERIGRWRGACEWPQEVGDAIAREARAQTASELVRGEEIVSVLSLLASEGIEPIVLKGTAHAYGLYDRPASRPRVDTDLLIRRTDVDLVRRTMARAGYAAPIHCDGDLLFCQFPLKKTDPCGFVHSFDFHWKISTQSVFADLMGFDEIAAHALDVPALGPHARTAGALHALLLACVHPVMHHRNAARLIWIHDVHLLASRLSDREFDSFAETAIAKRMAAVCASQLRAARRWLGTPIPERALDRLDAVRACEPSAAYLRPARRWSDELLSSIRGLPRWRDRLRLLREVALPGPTYMLEAYGLAPSSIGAALLPFLYLHRLSFGGWKVLAGQK